MAGLRSGPPNTSLQYVWLIEHKKPSLSSMPQPRKHAARRGETALPQLNTLTGNPTHYPNNWTETGVFPLTWGTMATRVLKELID